MTDVPDFVVIGHVCRDVQPDGAYLPGGTALYGALAAHRLGQRVGIVTAGDVESDLAALLPEAMVSCQHSRETTTFVNRYVDGRRTQHLLAVAPSIDLARVPSAWWTAPVVLLGPLTNEIDPQAVASYRPRWLAATPQGWLRRWDEDGLVQLGPLEAHAFNGLVLRVLVVSAGQEEQYAAALIGQVLADEGLVVITRGAAGSLVRHGRQEVLVRAPVVEEVDPTGAGDVFATTLVIRLAAGDAPAVAATYASVAGALTVTDWGVAGVPGAAAVERMLAEIESTVSKP